MPTMHKPVVIFLTCEGGAAYSSSPGMCHCCITSQTTARCRAEWACKTCLHMSHSRPLGHVLGEGRTDGTRRSSRPGSCSSSSGTWRSAARRAKRRKERMSPERGRSRGAAPVKLVANKTQGFTFNPPCLPRRRSTGTSGDGSVWTGDLTQARKATHHP